MRATAFLFAMMLSFAVQAANYSQEAYFTRIHRSLPYLLAVFYADHEFFESLTPLELEILEKVIGYSRSAHNTQWLIENRVAVDHRSMSAFTVREHDHRTETVVPLTALVRTDVRFS